MKKASNGFIKNLRYICLIGVIALGLMTIVGCNNNNHNHAPVANAGPDQNVSKGSLATLDGSGSSDADGDSLTYSWSFVSVPDGSAATLSDATVVNPTFTADLAGSYILGLVVNDGKVDSASDTVTITATNNAPRITSVGGPYAEQDVTYTYDVDATDANGDTLTYSLTTAPTDMTISSSTGLISWTPTSSQGGENNVVIFVSDGTDATTQSYTITVQTNTEEASVEITATEGGEVEVTDTGSDIYGAKVTIPPGALAQDSTVTIISTDNPTYVPPYTTKVKVEISGQSQALPGNINITIPYSEEFLSTYGITDESEITVARFDDNLGYWESLTGVSVDAANNLVSLTTNKTSSFMASIVDLGNLFQAFDIRAIKGRGFETGKRNCLLIHGMVGTPSAFTDDAGRGLGPFAEEYYDNVLVYQYPSGFSIEGNATRLVSYVKSTEKWKWIFGDVWKDNLIPLEANFDIIAHSMGGLVARYAIENASTLGNDTNNLNVDNLIMIGTPNSGAYLANVHVYFPYIYGLLEWADAEEVIPGGKDAVSPDDSDNDFFDKLDIGNKPDRTTYYTIAGNIGNGHHNLPWDGFITVESVDIDLDSNHRTFSSDDLPSGYTSVAEAFEHRALHDESYATTGRENGVGDQIATWTATIDVNGYWNVYHTTEGQTGEKGPDNWIITQLNSNISIDSCGEDSGSATGTISDSSISISWTEGGVTVSLTGTVSGDTMEGTWTETTGGSGTWRAEKTESHDVNIQTTSIQTDDQFDFSSGEVVTDGGDMKYINAYSGMATSTSYLGGGKVSGNYGEDYASFQCLVAFQSFLPDEDDWYTSESVYLFDGSFDARGKWTRWVQTREGKYAIVFVEDADENTLTMKWVYPYGSFTWQ